MHLHLQIKVLNYYEHMFKYIIFISENITRFINHLIDFLWIDVTNMNSIPIYVVWSWYIIIWFVYDKMIRSNSLIDHMMTRSYSSLFSYIKSICNMKLIWWPKYMYAVETRKNNKCQAKMYVVLNFNLLLCWEGWNFMGWKRTNLQRCRFWGPTYHRTAFNPLDFTFCTAQLGVFS